MNNFCQECGSPRSENAKFCANCGFKFHQEAEEEVKSDSETESQREVEIQECVEITQVENSIPQESKKAPQTPKIGGWLYLVAIGLIISPLFDIGSILNFLDTSVWKEVGFNYESDQLNKFNIKLAWGFLFINTTIVLFLLFIKLYATFSFFTKSKNTRFLMLLYCGASICFDAILIVFGTIQKDYSLIQDSSKTIIASTIWFFYFLVSQRVKNTFILNYSKKQKWFRIGLSSVIPLIVFVVFLFKGIFYFQNLEETRKKDISSLTKWREIFENPQNLLERFAKRKNEVVKQEVQTFSLTYSLKGTSLDSKSEIFNYIYNNPEYANLFQGIIYFCGLECSSIPQDLSKAYYYLNNLPYTQKEAMSMVLAEMNLYGIGTQQSLENAVKNANNATGLSKEMQATQYHYLALGYLYGAYFKKDIDMAITYLKKSADLDYSSSALLAALFMATEPKGKYNQQTIIHYFEKAILLNNSMAELWLAYYYYNNNEDNMAKNTLLNCSKTNSECEKAYQELFK